MRAETKKRLRPYLSPMLAAGSIATATTNV
jgi:hypothetical protein